MDGNARWARRHALPVSAGHAQGVEALRRVVAACLEWGIPALTVYGLSADNLRRRGAPELGALLTLVEGALGRELAGLRSRGVRLRFPGERALLPASVRAVAARAEEETAACERLHLSIALAYSARADVAAAAARLAAEVQQGQLRPEDATAEALAAQLWSADLPPGARDVDLLVRTSGEQRLSDFLAWEAAHAELVFAPACWPDFGAPELAAALRVYAARQRRFGGRPAL